MGLNIISPDGTPARLGGLGTPGKPGDHGKDGGYYTPEVEQVGENTLRMNFTPSAADMPEVDGAEITLPESTGKPGKSAYEYAVEGGFVGSEEDFAELLAGNSVKTFGAVGDGVTDDTAAFQAALAAERVVRVYGGTYVLSDTLVIRENCGLQLSQDTVLWFTDDVKDKNCIEMRCAATLDGNYAVVRAPYALTGHVIDINTVHDTTRGVPPYAHFDPMWKRGRNIYNVCIVKPDPTYGLHYSLDGTCSGTAIYLSADGTAEVGFIWGAMLQGIRIAGAFTYGIRAINFDDPNDSMDDDAWNHDMRVEAVIQGCETAVSMTNCNGAHLAVTVQPSTADDGTKYAKHGVYLNDSRFVDLIGSRVWDWNEKATLWTPGGQYQHLAMIGNCRGLLLDDFLVHETSADIRSLIYTDTASNFDTMTILQEPSNKWFKSIDNVPYFNNGTMNRKLMLVSDKFTAEQMEFIHPADGYYTYEPNFDNLVDVYTDGVYIDSGGGTSTLAGYATTDFIPIDGATIHTYRIGGTGIVWGNGEGEYCRIAWYNADKSLKGDVIPAKKIGSSIYFPSIVEDDTVAAAFATTADMATQQGAAYFRVTAKGSGANLVVTIDEEQRYTAVWHGEPKRLDESIHVMGDAVVLTSPSGKQFYLSVADDGTVTSTAVE